ncbi:hydrogenase maturation protein [Sulfuricaulis limicola]|uniref:Hydrogenase maturation protein n=1 Tax=Sulfuricaulis limicola TaxID=1620215 RepID=A0A1B4XG81_9GAMM|nr:hydrogenase maturation protein [Sulfuricaulis limicola]BAV33816.1 hydrogenase maturation protein [Sulfuricaulis limicola]
MRILFLTHSFNSLTQRLYVELTGRGHEISIEFDINDAVTIEAVRLFQPDLILAPYLRRAIPEQIWRHHLCLVVHPGIVGDRGPSALDWAILNGETEWGVTVLQANGAMDAGPVWATAGFRMRAARKSSLYRSEVTEAAVTAVLQALDRFESGGFTPSLPAAGTRGQWRPLMGQSDRQIDWLADDTRTILQKINSGDGAPGVADGFGGELYHLYDACEEDGLRGKPGDIIARRYGAICRATRDGAVWIGHLKKIIPGEKTFKLPAADVLGAALSAVPEAPLTLEVSPDRKTCKEIWYEEKSGVGYLYFDFYNGAMGTEQCQRLLEAYQQVRQRPTRVIVLMGGRDFWSNGIHLNRIEAADSPADESWRNINAMDDLVQAIITTDSQLTVAALRGNAGAGGAFLALAADRIYARAGVVLNPHYKNMGNLYGSEYWTYLLPRRVDTGGRAIMENRLPLGAAEAKRLGLIDDCFGANVDEFSARIEALAQALATDPAYESYLMEKRQRRARDEAARPLAQYRTEELERMKLNFYGFDPSYHVARYNFVFRVPNSWTPLHLARHRSISHKKTTNAA